MSRKAGKPVTVASLKIVKPKGPFDRVELNLYRRRIFDGTATAIDREERILSEMMEVVTAKMRVPSSDGSGYTEEYVYSFRERALAASIVHTVNKDLYFDRVLPALQRGKRAEDGPSDDAWQGGAFSKEKQAAVLKLIDVADRAYGSRLSAKASDAPAAEPADAPSGGGKEGEGV